MSLEDLVTGNLPEELERDASKEKTIPQISKEPYEANACFHLLREAKENLDKGSWQRLLSEAAVRLMGRVSDNGRLGNRLLLHLLEAQTGKESYLEKLREEIAFALAQVEEDIIFQSRESTLRYAEEEWGAHTAEILSRATDVREPTARRWLGGGNMSRRKYNSIVTTVLLYREALRVGFTPSSATIWLRGSSEDPLRRIAEYHVHCFRWIPWQIKDLIQVEERRDAEEHS